MTAALLAPCFACNGERTVTLTLGWTQDTHTSPGHAVDVTRECPFCHGTGRMLSVNAGDAEDWSHQDRAEIEEEIARRCLED